MVSWSEISPWVFTFGPFLLPKIISLWRTIRASTQSSRASHIIQPIPPLVARARNLLFLSVLTHFVLTLGYFQPLNVFEQTATNLHTPNSVIHNRLNLLGPVGPNEAILLEKHINTRVGRRNYLDYGPDVLLSCRFCDPDAPETYFYYTLPDVLGWHLVHVLILGLATSKLLAGREASRWRNEAVIAGASLLVGEATAWWLCTPQAEALRSFGARERYSTYFFFWRMRQVRCLCIILVDALLAAVLYLTSTNRWLVKPPSVAERLDMATRGVEAIRKTVGTLGAVTNAVVRDDALKDIHDEYWRSHQRFMAEVLQDEDVVKVRQQVLQSGSINMDALSGHAGQLSEAILDRLFRETEHRAPS